MVDLVYQRRKKIQIYLVAALLLVCCCILVACNSDNSYSVAGDTVSEPTHFMAKLMLALQNSMGESVSFGWIVVVFTIILRLILCPLDIWQKLVTRKNNKAMERMKPQLEALQEKYGDDKQRMQQEQMALYKKEHYSTLGMCLPTIVTFVVFFVVFAGFRQMVGYQYAQDYKACQNAYNTSISEQIQVKYGDVNADTLYTIDDIPKTEEGNAFYLEAKSIAQDKVKEIYYSDEQTAVRSFLWIKNIFVPDNWSTEVPNFETITGQSGFATSRLAGITIDEYNDVMGKVIGTGGYGKNGKWNGLLILPFLSIALSFLSTKLLSGSQAQAPTMPTNNKVDENGKPIKDQQQQSMKMMQYTMPIMMGVFALLYSGAFALYMFTSSFAAILFQLTFNLIAKLVDKSREGKGTVSVSKK